MHLWDSGSLVLFSLVSKPGCCFYKLCKYGRVTVNLANLKEPFYCDLQINMFAVLIPQLQRIYFLVILKYSLTVFLYLFFLHVFRHFLFRHFLHSFIYVHSIFEFVLLNFRAWQSLAFYYFKYLYNVKYFQYVTVPSYCTMYP